MRITARRPLAAATIAALAAVPAAAQGPATEPTAPEATTPTSPAPPRTPPPPPAAVRAGQDGPAIDLEWTGALVGAPRPGTSVCTTLRGPGAPGSPTVCVRGGRPMVAVQRRGGGAVVLDARVRRTSATSVAASVSASDLGLRPGAIRLRLVKTPGRPVAGSGTGTLTWRRVTLTGCTRAGAGQVLGGRGDRPRIALSFDDGPSTATPSVLSLLARYDAHATFFVLGQSAAWRPDSLRAVLASGNTLGNHSWAHARFPGQSDMASTNSTVRRITGYTPCTFRPPYGLTNGRVVSDANGLGMTSVLWSIDTNDWRRRGTPSIAHEALRARPGDIVLMHDGGGPRGQTVDALRVVLPRWRARGMEVVTVEDLLGYAPTYRVG